jgi:ParB-like chromosome segregation protein Spo0J
VKLHKFSEDFQGRSSSSDPQVKINPEYASLVSELSPEEYKSLKESIKENGLHFPIVVNQDGIILDGHHRYKACQELGIEPKTLVREFKDKLEEQLFVIDCNLVRRQLNNFQRIELALKSKPILEATVKRNESLGGKGGKGVRFLTPLGRVDERIGERAGVSRDTVRKVEKILENELITDKIKQDLRLGNVSINEAYKIVELDQEHQSLYQSLYQKRLKALEEFKKSSTEIHNQPKLTKEETERLRAQGEGKLWEEIIKPSRNYFIKSLEYDKAYAAFYFWIEYRADKNSDIESAASKTLKEIARWGMENGMQTLSWQTIEKILHHAAAENIIDIDKIRDSKVIQAELELIRREQEAQEKEN